ncbi:MAG TPA: AfsA-related hotdog domain-containing protein [Thermoleophilaceae bacterium]
MTTGTVTTDRASELELSSEHPIPREVVHKLAVAEVFVTDSARLSDDSMLLAGELPRSHYYYSDGGSFPARFDVMPILELCRQACFVMSHRQLGVPIGQQFILRSLGVELDPAAIFQRQEEPLRVTVRCDVLRRWTDGDRLVGALWRFTLRTPRELPVATATAAMSWMPKERWAEVRAGNRTQRGLPPEIAYARPGWSNVPPASVGRECRENVVVSDIQLRDGGVRATLIADILHPGLFDHYVDHLSGMLEAEACRQLALCCAGGGLPVSRDVAVSAIDVAFAAVGELDLPTLCTAAVQPVDGACDTRRVDAELTQQGDPLCRATLTVSTGPDA